MYYLFLIPFITLLSIIWTIKYYIHFMVKVFFSMLKFFDFSFFNHFFHDWVVLLFSILSLFVYQIFGVFYFLFSLLNILFFSIRFQTMKALNVFMTSVLLGKLSDSHQKLMIRFTKSKQKEINFFQIALVYYPLSIPFINILIHLTH